MFSGKYRCYVYHDKGTGFNFPFWGWILPAMLVVYVALGAGCYFFWTQSRSLDGLAEEVEKKESTLLAQRDEVLALTARLRSINSDVGDIAGFNTKLNIMFSLDESRYDAMSPQGIINGEEAMELPLWSEKRLVRSMHRSLHHLADQVRSQEVEQQTILSAIVIQQENLTKVPSIWPTKGRYSSPFGYRRSPFSGKRDFHKGIDITAPTGTVVRAPASGRISYADRFTTYGLVVEVSHGLGYMTRYAHLSKIRVRLGQRVARGDIIGEVGSTGRSTAPHLHYEVHYKGKLANPIHYILN